MKTLDKVLIIVGIFVLTFVITMIVLFCIFQSVPDTLIEYTLGTGGIEAIMCAVIKVFKLRNGEKIPDDDDDSKTEEPITAIEE